MKTVGKVYEMAARDTADVGARAPRSARRLSTETKASFKTSELAIWALVTIGILIAGNMIEAEEGGRDIFGADKVWLYITLLSGAYFVGRGLAKSGSREPYDDDDR